MPSPTREYHWRDCFLSVSGPQTFTTYESTVDLPAGHTLWKLLMAETRAGWQRPTDLQLDLQMYWVHIEVAYGSTTGAPVIFKTTRSLRHVLAAATTVVSDNSTYLSQWWGADQELGFDEQLTRGGFFSDVIPVHLRAAIYSSGSGTEFLGGHLDLPLRLLYSVRPPI
jgi:hypothetical protein